MSRNYYAEINLHIVWHTKASAPMLVPKVEAIVHQYLRGRCIETEGVFLHEIGGIENHVHLAVSITPTVTISDLVGQLKGASSHDANQKLGHKALEWQTGYGVVSFGTGDLEWVTGYVRNQRQRHSQRRVEDRLEQIAEDETSAKAESRQAP